MSDLPTRKVCYEELFNKFRNVANDWLKDTPEARGLYLVVDWAVGKNDFPFGHMVTVNDITEQSLLDASSQALKLLEALSNMYRQQINNTTSILKQAEVLIKQSKQV